MQDTLRDTTPRTAETPGEVRLDQFDCELPDEVRSELLRPKRATMLGRPPAPPPKRSWLDYARSWGHVAMFGLLGLVFIVALCSIPSWSAGRHTAVPAPTPARVQPTPVASPQPTQTIQPQTAVEPVVEQPILPPRAQLVLPPAPRAQLVRLPSVRTDFFAIAPERIDQTHTIMMPYGTEVSATLRGFLEQESQLPRVGRIGDMFIVSGTPWIFIQVPGTTAPTWIDP